MKKNLKVENKEVDGLTKLEKLHQTMKNEREAWKKLIENLNELQIKNRKPQ